MVLKEVTAFVLLCVATGMIIKKDEGLPPVAFDSSAEKRQQFDLETLKVTKNHLNTTLIHLGFKEYGPGMTPQLDEQWFVDDVPVKSIFLKSDNFAHGMSTYYLGDHIMHWYYIETKLPADVLREKSFKFIVRFFMEENLFDMRKMETRWFYSSYNYKITLKGKDLNFPDSGKTNERKFDTLNYLLSKENDLKNYEAKFSFEPKSASIIRGVTTSFEGFDRNNPADYLMSSSWCTNICVRGGEHVMNISLTGVSDSSKDVHIAMSDKTQNDFHGVFRVNVLGKNIANSEIEMSFDLTSYLYDGIELPFFSPKSLFITTHFSHRVGNKVVIYCRGFGYEYPSINSYKESGRTEASTNNEEFTYLYDQYVVTLIHTFDWKEENRGIYICKFSAQHHSYAVQSSIEV